MINIPKKGLSVEGDKCGKNGNNKKKIHAILIEIGFIYEQQSAAADTILLLRF